MKTFVWRVTVAALLLVVAAITACSSNTPSPTPTSTSGSSPTSIPVATKPTTRPAATVAPSGSSGDDEECSLAANIFGKAYKAGDSGPTPANFPPPPAGSHLCGSAANDVLGPTVIYTTTQTPDQIIQYYKSEAEKRGFQAKLNPTPPGVSNPDLLLSLIRETRTVAIVKALGNKGVFEINYPK